jgi:hypothetical protein
MPAPLRIDIPTDAPVPAMLTRALNVFVDKFGEQMICTAEERNLDGRLLVEVKYEIIGGPCAGRKFRLEFSLEPEGDVSTH